MAGVTDGGSDGSVGVTDGGNHFRRGLSAATKRDVPTAAGAPSTYFSLRATSAAAGILPYKLYGNPTATFAVPAAGAQLNSGWDTAKTQPPR